MDNGRMVDVVDLIERQKVIEALEQQKLNFSGESPVQAGIDVAISTVHAIGSDSYKGST